MKTSAFRLLTALAAVALGFGAVVAAETPEQVWSRIQSSGLEPDRAVEIHGVELEIGLAVLRFDDGVLLPTAPIAGRTAELVFIGEGSFRFEPPDPLEQAQLELFTEQTALDVPVESAVLTLGDSETTARLVERETVSSLDPRIAEEAGKVFKEWVSSAERRGFGADVAILGSVFDDVDASRFCAAWIRTEDLGNFHYVFDPAAFEQVTLGQFVALDADSRDERRIRREIQRGQRRGRFQQLRFEDLGDWDTWVSMSLKAPDGGIAPGSTGLEPQHYTIEATADPADGKLTGKTRIRMTAAKRGERVLTLSLDSDLAVSAVTDGEQPLPWFRSRDHLYVLLPQAPEPGQAFEIEIRYAGEAWEEIVKGATYGLKDSWAWYPHAGDLDRATYDVTLRWPKRLDVLASGRVTEGGEESGMRWEHRTLDVPSIAFSFEIGTYEVVTEKVGHVDLTVGFSKKAGALDKGAKEEVMSTLAEALPFFEQTFGAYPLDYLTVATVPRGFSQGFLGFITLSHRVVSRPKNVIVIYDSSFEDFGEARAEHRAETLAHELSHQWWGNKVGWRTYRDQWLSEALADFSASRYVAHSAQRKSVYLARRSKGWHASLGRGTKTGRTLESLGPVVMGSRLNSSLGSAYVPVVYDKGSVIFTMLGLLTGEEPLTKMLEVLADRLNHQVIDTPTFIRAIEKMSGLSLETFTRQFVYGTGVPEIYYTYDVEPQGDGTWLIHGEARQVFTGHFTYEVRRSAAGTWFVVRRRQEREQVAASAFIVPFQVAVAQATDPVTKGNQFGRKTTTERGLGGKLLINGEVSEFSVRLPKEPRDFWLDQRGEVLAQFFSEKHQPKRMLAYRGAELAAAGKLDEAETLLTRSLGAPLIPENEIDDTDLSKKEVERQGRLLDCRSQLYLARLYVEQERDAEARQVLESAEALLKGVESDYYSGLRQEVRCHLAVRAGDYEAAYDVLSKWLRLDFPYHDGEGMSEALRRNKFKTGRRRWGDGMDYALLAVSAFETGHADVALEAMKEAEKRAADMTELHRRVGS